MSERRRLRGAAPGTLAVLAVAAALLAAAPHAAAAQQTEEELVRHLRELRPRLDSARREADAARARVDARKALRNVTSIDTLHIGPLRILTPSDERRAAEGFFKEAWEQDYAPFVRTSPALERTTFTFQWSPEPGRIPVAGPARHVELRAWRPASAVRKAVIASISSALAEDLPDTVAKWAGPEVRDRTDAAENVLRRVSIVPSLSNRECLDGDVRACWASLGLDLDDTPLDEWYTPAERRAQVAAFPSVMRNETVQRACIDERSTRACDLFLEQWHVPPPLSDPSARKVMLWLALRAGGEGAWDRMRANPATPADALRAASGLGTDELAGMWRTWMLGGAPKTRAALDPHLLIDLMWIVAFAAFAMRSTRWRLR